jgi:para-aminobenzoate synthetase component 2
MARILVIDNYDSFVFNLVQYLAQLGAQCTVVRNDEVAADEASKYDGVLISPGPGTPDKAGVSIEMINYCAANSIPLFGVCLGHQAIGEAFGATVSRAPELLHGKTREELTEREHNEIVHCDAGCEWFIHEVIGSMISFIAL